MVRKIKQKLKGMTQRPQPAASFRARYDEAELRRVELLEKLAKLDEKAQAHPAYKRALTLLNQTFRKSSISQRLGVVQAAEWLIDVLNALTIMI